MAKFSVYNQNVDELLGWIKSEEIAIPEIQRPIVWETSKVRDLLDSLYKGYPVGYLIIWKNPDVKLKDGSISSGKKILIDGQQRIMALCASVVGEKVVFSNYKKDRLYISFNPLKEIFEVKNAAIEKDASWIADISEIFKNDFNMYAFITDYCRKNDLIGQEDQISTVINRLRQINNISLGITELSKDLSIEEVTDIFIRINSKSVILSQADFAMSKISADEFHGGSQIRKLIDYFCHFMQNPVDAQTILENDKEFSESEDLNKIKWVLNFSDDIYQPDYSDILRVAFTFKFNRGRLSDLVSLLSGRDFETRENTETIVENSFKLLKEGVEAFVNQTNFNRYVMILRSLGLVDKSMIRSQNTLNFGYVLYLTLRDKGINQNKIERIISKWIILSILTGRYSAGPESRFDYDIKRFNRMDPEEYVESIEKGELSDAFWNQVLINNLHASISTNPAFNVYLMAQVKNGARGFLSKQIDVKSLLEHRGDIHHIFPKKYLQKNNINNRRDYNQVANYALTQSEINIKIKDRAPQDYVADVIKQVQTGEAVYGNITDKRDLEKNFRENCIPDGLEEMNYENYEKFLEERRKLMAKYIRDYYRSF